MKCKHHILIKVMGGEKLYKCDYCGKDFIAEGYAEEYREQY